ncbi:MAG: hypothetical protein IJU55_03525 [Selenomonadaceae bacterium]|nr:hypothetical protein [Selenomonadaceae bacterium]
MNDAELNKKVGEFLALKKISKQIEADLENVKKELKKELTKRKTDIVVGESWRIDWKTVNRLKLDEKMLEEDIGDLSPYKKIIPTKYFYVKEI